jgi:uncharacterized protein YjbJ (UPF0337 family)
MATIVGGAGSETVRSSDESTASRGRPNNKEEILTMALPNKAEIKGKVNKAKGAVKENVGRATRNRSLEIEGAADRGKGAVQETVGRARRKVGDAVRDLGRTLRK